MSKIPIPISKGGKKFQIPIPIPIPTNKYLNDANSDFDSDLNQN